MFGAFETALREYVNKLCGTHKLAVITPKSWNYSKFRKLCALVDDFLVTQHQQPFLEVSLSHANQWAYSILYSITYLYYYYFSFHLYGWELNDLEFDDVQEGIISIRECVEKIEKLPLEREIIEKINKEIFIVDTDTDSAVESIHEVFCLKYLNFKYIQTISLVESKF